MPTLNIGGKRVKVDDSFLSLPPDQQNATVDEIAQSLGVQGGPPESDTSKNLRSELSGITQGFEKARGSSPMRTVDSFMRGAADLATFGMADEISAGLGAATGIGGEFGDYSGNLHRQRIEQEIRDRQDPISSNLGRVAGAVGSGVGLTKAGLSATAKLAPNAGLGARVAAGAKEGAAYGGAYGFGSGEGFTDRVKQAGGGAVMGAAIGGAVPGLVAGTKAVTKPVTDAISARVNPKGFAANKVVERLAASNQSPASIANKMKASPGATVADLSGQSGRNLLRTAVNIPGPGKDRVLKQLNLRQFGQGDRLKSAIGRTFADPDGFMAAKDELAAAAKQIAAPLYEKAFQRPTHYSEALEQALKTPAGQAALNRAQMLAANEQQPFRQVFININGEARRVPDTRGWHYIKTALDDMIEEQIDSQTRKMTNAGRILVGLKNRILHEVDRLNPDYKAARAAYGGIAQIDEALEFGRKALTMSPEAVRREVGALSATQKEAARIGAAEEMRKAIDGAGYTNNAILKVFNSRQRVANLRSLFDNDRQFAEFRKTIFQEARKRATYDAVKGNSTTASQLADMFEAGGANEAAQFAGRAVTQGPVTATLQWVGSALRRLGGLTPQVADEMSRILMSASPAEMRMIVNELIKIDRMQIAADQKARLVQALIAKVLTSQSVAVGQ